MSDIAASIVITSRNRRDELLKAIASCFTQTVPVEVVYLDDASDDGSPIAVANCFPQVRVYRAERHVGLVVLRNRGAQLARTNFIFSIDDDAIFTSPYVVEQTLKEFDNPRVGAVAIPFRNVRISDELLQRAPDSDEIYATRTYVGTAHALRRDVFVKLGGYRQSVIHQGEESDYCIRMLEHGYIVRLGCSDEIHHFVSPKRDLSRQHYYGTRNFLLFFYHYADPLRLPFYLMTGTALEMVRAIRLRAFGIKMRAIIDAYRDLARNAHDRQPVSPGTFRMFRALGVQPQRLSALVDQLNPLSPLIVRGQPGSTTTAEVAENSLSPEKTVSSG
jgi:glycosyltransferase involved in cell wall biosynthesis